jgi:hypothetical protein
VTGFFAPDEVAAPQQIPSALDQMRAQAGIVPGDEPIGASFARGVGQVAGSVGGALKRAATGLQLPSEQVPESPQAAAALAKLKSIYSLASPPTPFRVLSAAAEEPYQETVGRAAEASIQAGEALGQMEADIAEAHPRPAYAEDFWSGLKNPDTAAQTLAVHGLESLPNLLATMGAAVAGGPVGGLAAGYVQETGQAYNEAKAQGSSEEEAQAISGWVGLTNMALEYLPAGKLLGQIGKGASRQELASVLGGLLSQAAMEGGTESIQELNQIVTNQLVDAQSQRLALPEIAARVGQAGIVGAVAGGGVGGAVAMGQQGTEASPQQEIANEEEGLQQQDAQGPVLPDVEEVVQPQEEGEQAEEGVLAVPPEVQAIADAMLAAEESLPYSIEDILWGSAPSVAEHPRLDDAIAANLPDAKAIRKLAREVRYAKTKEPLPEPPPPLEPAALAEMSARARGQMPEVPDGILDVHRIQESQSPTPEGHAARGGVFFGLRPEDVVQYKRATSTEGGYNEIRARLDPKRPFYVTGEAGGADISTAVLMQLDPSAFAYLQRPDLSKEELGSLLESRGVDASGDFSLGSSSVKWGHDPNVARDRLALGLLGQQGYDTVIFKGLTQKGEPYYEIASINASRVRAEEEAPSPLSSPQESPSPSREEERFARFLSDKGLDEDAYYAAPKIKKVALDVEFGRKDQGPGAGWDEFLAEHGVAQGDLSTEGRRQLEEDFFREIGQKKLTEPKVKTETPPPPTAPEVAAVSSQEISRPPLTDNSTGLLSRHVKTLYRESNLQGALRFIDPNWREGLPRDVIHMAELPEMALGQGKNKGVLLEFDSADLQGQVNLAKPGLEEAFQRGAGEYLATLNDSSSYKKALRSFTVQPDAKAEPGMMRRLQEIIIPGLEKRGWAKESLPNGAMKLTAPSAETKPFVPPQVKKGTAQGGFIGTGATVSAPSPGAFSAPHEEIFQEQRKGLYEGWREKADKALAGVKEIGHWASREHHRLGHGAKFTVARDALRVVGHQPEIAVQETARKMRKILGDLSDSQRELFERRMLLDNSEAVRKLLPDAGLPGGLTDEEVAKSRPGTDAAVDADPRVKQAVEDTRDLWRSVREPLAEAYREIGMDPEFLYRQGDAYFHHQVLDYAKDEVARNGGVSGTLKKPKGRSWQRELKGSELPISLNYYEAQAPVIAQMQIDAAVAKQLARVQREYDIAPELRRMADAENKKRRAEAKKKGEEPKLVNWEEMVPEGHTVWQPQKGEIFYVGERLVDRVAKDVISKGSGLVTPEDLKKSLMVGGPREQWVIPTELAETLDDFGKRIDDRILKGVHAVSGWTQRKWKGWQLLSPRRAAKYLIRNLVGDAQSVTMGNPSAFKKWKESAGEIGRFIYGGKDPAPHLQGWMARGGLNTTLFEAEMSRADQDRVARMGEKLEMQGFLRQLRSAPTAPLKAYFKTMRRHANYVEAILRYATYKDYLSQIEKNPEGRPKNFGASREDEIMALPEKEDRAFWLSNELLGSYDQVSQAGQYARENWLPFWSFQELNMKRTYRLMRNALMDENHAKKMATRVLGVTAVKAGSWAAVRAGQFLALAYAFEGILYAVNHLFFPSEEEDLPLEEQRRAHIILGRNDDGSVRYFSRLSAFEEARNWFGLDQFGWGIHEYLSGRKTAREVAIDMAKAPLNQIVGSITPLGIKGGLEVATRMSTFPDVTKPRRITDLPDHLAKMFGVEHEFRAATMRPDRPGSYPRSLRELVIYETEPGQAAYFDSLNNKDRFLKSQGKEGGGSGFSSRTNALRSMKQALRYGQKDVALKFLQEYAALGGTPEDIENSLNRMDPLSGLDEDEQEEFRKWLSADDVAKLEAAIEYHSEMLDSGGEFLDSAEAEVVIEAGAAEAERNEEGN